MSTTATRFKVFANLYKDSVTLMQLGAQLRERDGIAQASCLMATPANLAQLEHAQLTIDAQASPSDLLVVVRGETEACAAAIEAADAILQARGGADGGGAAAFSLPLTSIALGVEHDPDADLALISVPGDYAACRSDEGARARPARHDVLGQRRDRRGARDQDRRARQGPARHGPGLRHGDRQRNSARLRQRRPTRRHRSRRRFRHRPAGGHVPDPQPGRRDLAGARHRRPRPEGGNRWHHDAAGARRARRGPADAGDRPDLEAAGAGDRPAHRGRRGERRQARRHPLPRRIAAAQRAACSAPGRCATRPTSRWLLPAPTPHRSRQRRTTPQPPRSIGSRRR